MPPCPATAHWWQTQVPGLLVCWQLWLGAYSVGFFFFSLPVMLPSEIPKLPTDPPVRGFLLCGNFSSFMTPSPGQVSIPNSFVSVFVFYICPTSFWREWVDFLGAWYPPSEFRNCFVEVAQHSDDLLMYLWGRKWSPILFLHHLWIALLFNSSYSVPWMSICLAWLIALLTLSVLLLIFIYQFFQLL